MQILSFQTGLAVCSNMLYKTLKGDFDQAKLSSLQLCSCPHFYEQRQTTTPRTRFPTLWGDVSWFLNFPY